MKELAVILEKYKELEKTNQSAVLATMVDVVCSGYRRPGARMLIDEKGFGIGTVSGGCLEADVLERAKKVLRTSEPTVITYDTTKDENSLFGLGMGCRGIVRILLESVADKNEFLPFLSNHFDNRKSCTIVSLISTNESNLKIGSRLLFDETSIVSNDFNDEITNKILPSVNIFFTGKTSNLETFDFGDVFIETVKPPLNLLLFGTGYDALPVVKFAKEIGWRVTAIDHRAAFANRERLPETDEIIVSHSEDLRDEIFRDENSVAVIMTHNYDRDREILRRLLNSKCRYIGALGPKKRTEKLLDEIGESFSDAQLEKLYAPVGLDIGADTPEAIALSIVAEIQSVLSDRDGGFLRLRQASIYNRK